MAKKAKNVVEWYPNEGTHNNILDMYRKKFYEKTKLFMDQIINSTSKIAVSFKSSKRTHEVVMDNKTELLIESNYLASSVKLKHENLD